MTTQFGPEEMDSILGAVEAYLTRLREIRERWPEPQENGRVAPEIAAYYTEHLLWRRRAGRAYGMARTALLKKLEEE